MKKIILILSIIIASACISVAQESDSSEVYRIVQVMPEYPGGNEAMHKFIADNVVYPQVAKDSNITGIIYIRFVIEKDGSISNVTLAEDSDDIGGGCVEEGIRIVKSMPNWKPGTHRNKPERVSYFLPIEFTLSKKAQRKNKKNKN